MTFDGWDARYYGDAMGSPGEALEHFRTKGSKNGVRRYQQEDGSWTPLGLRMRKAREGWGERRKEKREIRREKRKQKDKLELEKAKRVLAEHKDENARYKAKLAAKTKAYKAKEKAKADRLIRRIDRREQLKKRYAERNNLKNLSDEELKKRIERVKMEKEYKELTRSPALAAGEKMLKSFLDSRKAKRERAEKKAKMEKDMIEAKAKLATAEADKAFASKRGNVAARKIAAKADFKKQKNQERKQTIRGAISQAIHNNIQKRGQAHEDKIGKKTYWDSIQNGGKRVGRILKKSGQGIANAGKKAKANSKERKEKKRRQQAALQGRITRLSNYYNNGGW